MNIRLLTGGLIAGCVVGIVVSILHFSFLQELILKAEQYESGALVHFGEADTATSDGQSLDHSDAHSIGHEEDGPQSDIMRNAMSVLFACLIYAGYGLILSAAYQAARQLGYHVTPVNGILWGLAGFIVIQMAPSMGLSPNLPGTVSADIDARQIWWFGTMAATGLGIACFALGKSVPMIILGIALLAAPHVIGAPQLEGFAGLAPPEMAATFATRVIGVALVAWVLLGWLTAKLTEPSD